MVGSVTEAVQRAVEKTKEILTAVGIIENFFGWKIKEEDFTPLMKGANGRSLNNNSGDTSNKDLTELLYKMTGLY